MARRLARASTSPSSRDYGADVGFQPPGVGPTPTKVYRLSWLGLDNVNLSSDQLAVFVVAAIVAGVLYVVLRRTRVGLEMRAQVDRDSLAALRGVNPRRTSGVAWMLSMTLAGLGGVLIAPLFQLNDNDLRCSWCSRRSPRSPLAGMRSIPLAFAAGLALGVLQNLIAGYKNDWLPNFLSSVSGLDAAVPYFILLVALFVVGRERGRHAGTVSDEKPAPDHRAGLPGWRRKLPWAIFTALLVLYTLGAFPWPNNPYFVRSEILAPGARARDRVPVVRGRHRHRRHGEPRPGHVRDRGRVHGRLGAADADRRPPAAVGELGVRHPVRRPQRPDELPRGVPARRDRRRRDRRDRRVPGAAARRRSRSRSRRSRSRGSRTSSSSPTTTSRTAPSATTFRFPTFNPFGLHKFDFSKSSQLVCMLLIVFGVVTLLIHNLQRSPSGRAMYAVRSSPVAARTSGISPAKAQVALFALSAGIAGFGGAMYGLTAFSITATSVPPFTRAGLARGGVTFGIRRPGGALLAGLGVHRRPGDLAGARAVLVDAELPVASSSRRRTSRRCCSASGRSTWPRTPTACSR